MGKSAIFESAPFVVHYMSSRPVDNLTTLTHCDTIALVISPLIALVKTQVEDLKKRGIKAAFLSDVVISDNISADNMGDPMVSDNEMDSATIEEVGSHVIMYIYTLNLIVDFKLLVPHAL